MYHCRAMKSFWCKFVMISVLFMSLDGAADIESTGHPHGDDGGQLYAAQTVSSVDTASASDFDVQHCEHCCHGHTFSIVGQIAAILPSLIDTDQQAAVAPQIRHSAHAPPTPPPNV